MSCPNCNMNLGWGPVQELPENSKWYKSVKPLLKCAHCGAYVTVIHNKLLQSISYTSFLVAFILWSVFYNIEYKNIIIGIAITLGVSTLLTLLVTFNYKLDKSNN